MESDLDLVYNSIIFEADIFGIFWCPLNVVKKRDFYDVLQENIVWKIKINKLQKKKERRNEFQCNITLSLWNVALNCMIVGFLINGSST